MGVLCTPHTASTHVLHAPAHLPHAPPRTSPSTHPHAQVFYAPHISRMSSVLGTRFQPIQYRLTGDSLVSNVRYSNPLLGEGWLSAGGEAGWRVGRGAGQQSTAFSVDLHAPFFAVLACTGSSSVHIG